MRYVEFLDIDVPYAGALGTIEFDPWLAAVASLKTVDGKPMVTHWIDPSPAMSIEENGATKLRDAAHDGVMTSVPGVAALQKTNAINGQPTFTATEASTLSQGTSPDVNADEWTLLAVHDFSGQEPRANYVFSTGDGSLSGNLFPTLDITLGAPGGTPAISIREGGTPTRRIFRGFSGLMDGPAISVGTFSVDRGLSVFMNNMVGFYRETEDKRPLTMPTFSYLGNRNASNTAIGVFGMALILRADLSRPEYRAAKDIIINGLMTKYGIY